MDISSLPVQDLADEHGFVVIGGDDCAIRFHRVPSMGKVWQNLSPYPELWRRLEFA